MIHLVYQAQILKYNHKDKLKKKSPLQENKKENNHTIQLHLNQKLRFMIEINKYIRNQNLKRLLLTLLFHHLVNL